jgi:hypothetical protein
LIQLPMAMQQLWLLLLNRQMIPLPSSFGGGKMRSLTSPERK